MAPAKGALIFVPSAVAAGMCYWQLQRMRWKVRGAGRRARARVQLRAGRAARPWGAPPAAAPLLNPARLDAWRRSSRLAAPATRPTPPCPLPLGLGQEGVVQEAQAGMADAPRDVFALDELPRFRRCSAEGAYDHGRAVFVGPRPIRCMGGSGISPRRRPRSGRCPPCCLR
jgi:hypothetical protein